MTDVQKDATNSHTVTLRGGPLHGETARVHDRQTILVIRHPYKDGYECIYRPTLYMLNDWHFQLSREIE